MVTTGHDGSREVSAETSGVHWSRPDVKKVKIHSILTDCQQLLNIEQQHFSQVTSMKHKYLANSTYPVRMLEIQKQSDKRSK